MKNRSFLLKNCIALLLSLCLLCTAAVPAFAAKILLGDLDTDGALTAEDARLALRLAVRLDRVNAFNLLVGDVNCDGNVTAEDARVLLRVSVELESLYGRTVNAKKPAKPAAQPEETTTRPAEPSTTPSGPSVTPEEPSSASEKPTGAKPAEPATLPSGSSYESLYNALPKDIPPPPIVNAPHGTFTIVSYGWGHCVGLSQEGAKQMALVGLPYDYILRYYFVGTCIVLNPNYPKNTYYAGETVNTEKLLCKIVSQEIGGADTPDEALKAQAVAVFTLLKRNGFHVESKSSVGYDANYENCSTRLKNAVHSVMGQYLALGNDPELKPILSVYGAMAAGRTLGCSEVWTDDYPISVYSPFEASLPQFAEVRIIPAEEMRAYILAWNGKTVLSENPAEWIKILKHDGSLDANRGYVTAIRVGNKTIRGIGGFDRVISLRSPCFTVAYTP